MSLLLCRARARHNNNDMSQVCPDGRGLVVLTNDDRFFSVANFTDPKPRRLASFKDNAQSGDDGGAGAGAAVTAWDIHMNER